MTVITTVALELHVQPAHGAIWGTHRKGGLPSSMSIEAISERLGFSPDDPQPSDGKITQLWLASARIRGTEGVLKLAVWDYKGMRWSVWANNASFAKALLPEITWDT